MYWENYAGILLSPTCIVFYVNIQDNYVHMQHNLSRTLT